VRGVNNKHNECRPATVQPGSPEGREIGLSDRVLGTPSPIPGGEHHLVNPQTVRQEPATVQPRPEFRGTMAHGVPAGKHTAHERADAMRGPNTAHDPRPPAHARPTQRFDPVPVRIVASGRDVDALLSSSHVRKLVPVFGSEPVRLVGRNSERLEVHLLNEDATTHVRFGHGPADLLVLHNGTVLPATTSSYTKFKVQDELWAISDADTGTGQYVSIIEVFDYANAEVP
jgi:hypothetical protein